MRKRNNLIENCLMRIIRISEEMKGVLNRLKAIDFDNYKLKVQEIPDYFKPEELYGEEILEFKKRMANYKPKGSVISK